MKIYPIELSKLYAAYKDEYRQAFDDVLEKGIFVGGDYVDIFEHEAAKYLGAKYVVGCGNGTHAIELALMANGIGSGCEVITVANTYYATARAIVDIGAEPVFCDVNKYGLIDVNLVERLITPRTKAIVPVHLYGAPADLTRLNAICEKYGLVLVEDCSHAFGSSYNGQKIGSDSICACFSLYPTKNLGAMGDAGMVATNSKEITDRLKAMRYYTIDPERNTFNATSIHSRIDPLQCGLLRVSLRHIDEWNQRRVSNAKYLIEIMNNRVPYIESVGWNGIVPYVFPILVNEQIKIEEELRAKGIIAQVHYRPDLHKIDHLTHKSYHLPMTEKLNRSVLSIPISPTVSKSEIDYIAASILQSV